ncbi:MULTISPECIES: hypothetical protein [Exiguobacterium]|uniref:hypothetical protein n=1 Tax=Exiguobacterium TaxID=33986 RepID=UPI001BE9D517|nr:MULTISPECIES: hypothetical protein [Exiguobacterium]MCT4793818.1 hypothetical protein [Exiguobacterium artemiae]
MNMKSFLLSFILIYLLLSFPAFFGINYVIDWVPEATLGQKFNGYVIEGLGNQFLLKSLCAAIASIVLSLLLSNRKAGTRM